MKTLILSAGAVWSALYSCNAWLKSARFRRYPPGLLHFQLVPVAPSFGGTHRDVAGCAIDPEALKALDIIVTRRRRLYQRNSSKAA